MSLEEICINYPNILLTIQNYNVSSAGILSIILNRSIYSCRMVSPHNEIYFFFFIKLNFLNNSFLVIDFGGANAHRYSLEFLERAAPKHWLFFNLLVISRRFNLKLNACRFVAFHVIFLAFNL